MLCNRYWIKNQGFLGEKARNLFVLHYIKETNPKELQGISVCVKIRMIIN